VGIVNGMDIGDWSPMVDKYIRQRYGKDNVAEGKEKNKEAVQSLLGLAVSISAN
jgi:glycogen synthase